MTKTKCYSELMSIPTFEERFAYLKLEGLVGESTFGPMRFSNQNFYRSYEWRKFRRDIILRDCGCDLAFDGRDIFSIVVIHHIVPLTAKMLNENSRLLMAPENVICCSDNTHKAIHYGDANLLDRSPYFVERKPNDTIPWRQ